MFRRHAHWAGAGCRPGFGSWGPRSRFFGPGEVRLAILSLLADGPRHGYELMKMLAQRSGGMYRASAGTIYPTLQQLEDEGLIAAEVREGKRVFHITEAGRRELHLEDDIVERIWRRAIPACITENQHKRRSPRQAPVCNLTDQVMPL